MSKETEKFANGLIFEGMTSISAIINSQSAQKRRIIKIFVDKDKLSSKSRELSFLKSKQRELGFEILTVDSDFINSKALGTSHGGIIAECSEREYSVLTDGNIKPNGFYVYLEGIEDPYNFGYTLRSLFAAGADGIVLSPRNWMSAAGVVARASAGASELLDIFISSPEDCAALFRKNGYKIAAAGIRDSVSLYEADMTLPILLVVGGEKRGISRAVLDIADSIVRIDYGREFRGSLSAASAATVLAFEILRQNKK